MTQEVRCYPEVKKGLFTYQVKLITFAANHSHHCGYVSFPSVLREFIIADELQVHGGVTFDKEIENGLYCIGFDCAHSGDSSVMGDPAFRDYWYVENECLSLLRQIRDQLFPEQL